MFIRARVPVATYLDALTVPQQAVVRPGGKASLWTIDNQHLAHLIPIELGELLNHRYRIVSGLKKGQQIVVEGMERLIDGKPVTLSQPAATSASAKH